MRRTTAYLKACAILLPPALLLATCATSINPGKLTKEAQTGNVAIVTGQASSFFSEYDMASTEYDVRILSVNGKETHDAMYGHAIQVKVPPGKTELKVACGYSGLNTSTASYTSDVSAVLEAGHVYKLAPSLVETRCVITLQDVTTQNP